jgi:hypothetical protein
VGEKRQLPFFNKYLAASVFKLHPCPLLFAVGEEEGN